MHGRYGVTDRRQQPGEHQSHQHARRRCQPRGFGIVAAGQSFGECAGGDRAVRALFELQQRSNEYRPGAENHIINFTLLPLTDVDARVRREDFVARPGTQCRFCALRRTCPASDEGQEVLP